MVMKMKIDIVKALIMVLVIILAGMSGFFYYRITRLESRAHALESAFETFQNSYSSLRSEHVDLQEMYSSLRSEYTDLQNRHSTLEREKNALQNEKMSLQNEYDEILSLEKRAVLEEDKTYDLAAGGNTTLTYDTLFAGYIELNFTASMDIYFWVGSSLTQDTFYARYPPFPKTATNGTVIIPVCSTVYLYINNPNELMNATVTLTITYVY